LVWLGGAALAVVTACGPNDVDSSTDTGGAGGAAVDGSAQGEGAAPFVDEPCPDRPGYIRYRHMCFNRVEQHADLAYAAPTDAAGDALIDSQGAPLALDLFTPPDDDPNEARPTIVLAHGGGFTAGSRKDSNIRDLCNTFALHGYVCASISYRLSTVGVGAQTVKHAQADMKAAVRWLKAHASDYRLDVTRFAVGGASAGAVTALHGAYLDDEGSSGTADQSSSVAAVLDLWGAYFGDTPNVMDPLVAGDAPLMIVHGEYDNTFGVDYPRSGELFEQTKATGVPSRFFTIRGVGHSPWKCGDNIAAAALDFFYAYLVSGTGEALQIAEDLPCSG
jgi:acetyl esterase/lipase